MLLQSTAVATFFGILSISLFFLLPIIGMWKIFEKANKPGWAVIIPIYNIVVFLEIIGESPWWIILFLIPYVNIIALIVGLNLLVKCFGKNTGFTIGVIDRKSVV